MSRHPGDVLRLWSLLAFAFVCFIAGTALGIHASPHPDEPHAVECRDVPAEQ